MGTISPLFSQDPSAGGSRSRALGALAGDHGVRRKGKGHHHTQHQSSLTLEETDVICVVDRYGQLRAYKI